MVCSFHIEFNSLVITILFLAVLSHFNHDRNAVGLQRHWLETAFGPFDTTLFLILLFDGSTKHCICCCSAPPPVKLEKPLWPMRLKGLPEPPLSLTPPPPPHTVVKSAPVFNFHRLSPCPLEKKTTKKTFTRELKGGFDQPPQQITLAATVAAVGVTGWWAWLSTPALCRYLGGNAARPQDLIGDMPRSPTRRLCQVLTGWTIARKAGRVRRSYYLFFSSTVTNAFKMLKKKKIPPVFHPGLRERARPQNLNVIFL